MNWPLRVARRYLFAKKSTNIINVITGISVLGIAIGSAALVLVLSVFNGFEDLITSMYGNFNPDIKVTPEKGKTFVIDSLTLQKIRGLGGVVAVSQTLEEVAFFEYKDKQDFGILKGVDPYFAKVTGIDSTVREGQYQLDGARETAVLGLGMRNKLAVSVDNVFESLSVYMPKRRDTGPFEPQFRKRQVFPVGTFIIQQDFDNQYVLTSLEFARDMLGDYEALSALEIRLAPGFNSEMLIPEIRNLLGEGFVLKNRYAQEEAFMKLMKVEKWMSFAIVSLMMLLVAFNMVGALWMIVLEKKYDIAMLKSMGALDRSVRNIFLNEGLLLSLIGVGSGFVLALVIYWIQKTHGIVSIPGAFAVESYPISLRWIDFFVVGLTVTAIGLLASVPPALRAQRVPAMIREE